MPAQVPEGLWGRPSMPGVNLSSRNRFRLRQLFWKYMTQKTGLYFHNRVGQPRHASFPIFMSKQGVPASNSTTDSPGRGGAICIDTLNKDVYLSTTFTAANNHTWTKISD